MKVEDLIDFLKDNCKSEITFFNMSYKDNFAGNIISRNIYYNKDEEAEDEELQ